MNGNNPVLLDTNIIIELFRGNRNIANELQKLNQVSVPYIVLGELYAGAYYSSQRSKNFDLIKGFFEQCHVLFADEDTCKTYGKLRAELQRKGTPIPENDIWIAALAQQHNMTLISNDRHFAAVAGISLSTI